MTIYSLSSGSKGNMTLLNSDETTILIDLGISKNKMKDKLSQINMNVAEIHHVLITHEHSDHTAGLKKFFETYQPNIYMTKGTYESLSKEVQSYVKNTLIIIQPYQSFFIETMKITPFLLSHDAKEPVGFVIEHNDKKVVHGADTGYIDISNYALLKHADVYMIESNHHPELLLQSPRPMQLKKRILGEKGHLSNDDASTLINQLMGDKHTIWMITHISEDCNSDLEIERAIVRHIHRPLQLEIVYARQYEISKVSL